MKTNNINQYIDTFLTSLKSEFGDRLVYVGLQGSFRRGEANERSDIDLMVVLDEFRVEDMGFYRFLLVENKFPVQACGFICGLKEITNWNPGEVCQLTHETKDLYGNLASITPSYDTEDVRRYVQICVGNLYHEICHRYIYTERENSRSKLPYSYKQVFYILQNLYYLRTCEYIITKKELLSLLKGEDLSVLQMSLTLRDRIDYDFDKAYNLLFCWCQHVLQQI